ncbi:MAG: tetratricopeptide repeat protein [Myxococcales bacterium]|nr:tetratricopeptide repeat protein [Myxococcales bacterium]
MSLALAAPVWGQGAPAFAIRNVAVHPDLSAAKELIDDEKFYDAFSKLADLLPTLPPDDSNRLLAQLLLGRTLYGLQLFQSALRAFDSVLVPADNPLYREKIRYYLLIQRAVPGDLATIERLADAPESVHKKEDLDETRFLLGRYYYSIGDEKRAIEQMATIKPGAGEIYLKSKHLLGVVYVKLNQAQPALEAFKDILRFEERVGTPKFYAQYKDMANVQLGRLFYSIGQFETAGRYYDNATEGTTMWLDSLFELGWTYFQLGRIDRVLGQLHTLNSPYFEDRYYPEARVLEALILFRTCRFPETLVVVQRFLRDYKPLKKELDAQLAGARTDAEFYEYLAALARDKASLSVQLRRIFNVALNDKRLQRAFSAVVLANEEVAGLEKLERNVSNQKFAHHLTEDMGRVRAVMIAEAGGLARQRLQRVREDLTEIIRQGLRIKYESLKARRGSINDQVRKEMQDTAKIASEPREDDSEHIVWPFDGSYWRDELGGYTYDTRSKCTAAQMGAGAAAVPSAAKDKSGRNKAPPARTDAAPAPAVESGGKQEVAP